MIRLALVLAVLALLTLEAGEAQVVDSLLPPVEELRRFQATLATKPTAFQFGAASRGQLVRTFVTALERADSAALRRLLITREEFGTLIYPTSEYAKPPYFQKPALVWFQLANVSTKGLTRLLGRDAGTSLGFRGYVCPVRGRRRGANTTWNGCKLRVAVGDSIRTRQLFGSIVERGQRFKFLSYATEY